MPIQYHRAGDDAATAANNIVNNETLFRVGGVGSELIILYDRDRLSSRALCTAQTRQQNAFSACCRFPPGDDHHSWSQPDQLLLCYGDGLSVHWLSAAFGTEQLKP